MIFSSISQQFHQFTVPSFSVIADKIKLNTLSTKQKVLLVAIGIFSCLVTVYGVYRYLKHRKIEQARVIEQKAQVIELNGIQGKVVGPVVNVLEQHIFKDTPYSFDQLPIYQDVLNPNDVIYKIDDQVVRGGPGRYPRKEQMTDPVMKGVFQDGRTFIAIRVDYEVQEEELGKYLDVVKDILRKQPKQQEIIFIHQYKDQTQRWVQSNSGGIIEPNFFDENITDQDGNLVKVEKDHLKLIQALLKNGEAVDLNQRRWRLPAQEV